MATDAGTPPQSSQTAGSRSSPLTHLRLDRRDGGVAVLTLDLPERRNAMSVPMTASWAAAVAALSTDPEVRAVVVTGAGSAFCSGGDTEWLVGEPDASVDRLRDRMLPFYRTWLSIRDLEVPTIAAVNGAAVGAGCCLALACDIRYAAADARFSVPFVRLGMHPGMGATYLLAEVVGLAAARDLLLTGRTFDAEEARHLGLVSRVVAPATLLDEALAVAHRVAATAPIASRSATRTLRRPATDLESALQAEALAQSVTLTTRDLREGLAAARERRAPDFRGR